MIRHILKLMWNRKRNLAWIFIEQVFVFGVLVFCFTSVVNRLTQHFSKGNIRVDNIAYVNSSSMDRNNQTEDETEADNAQFRNMVERMKEWQTVELVSFTGSGSIPALGNMKYDSISFNERRCRAVIKYCDENFYRMFLPKLTEGQWFRDADASLEIQPALITQRLAESVELSGKAVGQTILYKGRTYRVTGIVEAFKDKPNEEQQPALFIPFSASTDMGWNVEYAVKFKPGTENEFLNAFITEYYRNFPRDKYLPFSMVLSEAMGAYNIFSLLMVYLLSIPTLFLLIFAFMGTFGVVWMQTKKRISEMGLRIALGSTPARLMYTIILENLILTTVAMLPGLIVVAFLYAYAPEGWEWVAAVGAAIIFMWLFSAISAWYPARKAAKVQPVEALKSNQ